MDVRVALRGRELRVACKLLHHGGRYAALEERRHEEVTKRMEPTGRDLHLPHRGRERLPDRRGPPGLLPRVEGYVGVLGATVRADSEQRLPQRGRQGDLTVAPRLGSRQVPLVLLEPHDDPPLAFELHIAATEPANFAPPQSRMRSEEKCRPILGMLRPVENACEVFC